MQPQNAGVPDRGPARTVAQAAEGQEGGGRQGTTAVQTQGGRCGYAATLPQHGVHPGWPGLPRPPRIPGLHRARRAAEATGPGPYGEGWSRLATSLPGGKVHPGWPRMPKPPGLPGSHRTARASSAHAIWPSGVSLLGREAGAVTKALFGKGCHGPGKGEPRKNAVGRSQGRNSVRTQRNFRNPQESPPRTPGNPDVSGTCSIINWLLSFGEYPSRGSGNGHYADGKLRPEQRRTLASYPTWATSCPGEPLGEPQRVGVLLLGEMGVSVGCTLVCPFPCALLPRHRSSPSPELTLARSAS